jgi:hypothetical protein
MNIIKTDNVVVSRRCDDKTKTHVCELFNMPRGAGVYDIVPHCYEIWKYDMDLFVALLFYMRDIRKNPSVAELGYCTYIPKGRGEKLLSYWMALWLLNTHAETFVKNFTRFVRDIGYYKDCIIMAKMALKMNYSDHKIMMILMPLARALADDENKILTTHLSGLTKETLRLSLASKWAPRQGKSYSALIPYMKTLCNITGPKSDAKWRKYIQSIVRATTTDTIETLLSTKNYDKINFKAVPSKAFILYENKFLTTPELTDQVVDFIHHREISPPNLNGGVNSLLSGLYCVVNDDIADPYNKDPASKTFRILNAYKQIVA